MGGGMELLLSLCDFDPQTRATAIVGHKYLGLGFFQDSWSLGFMQRVQVCKQNEESIENEMNTSDAADDSSIAENKNRMSESCARENTEDTSITENEKKKKEYTKLLNSLVALNAQDNTRTIEILDEWRTKLTNGDTMHNPVKHSSSSNVAFIQSSLQFDLPKWAVYDKEDREIVCSENTTVGDEFTNRITQQVQTHNLIKDHKMDEAALLKLVEFTNVAAVNKSWVNYATFLANGVLPPMWDTAHVGGVLLQQVVYSRFAALFAAFCGESHYRANEMVTWYETIATRQSADGKSGGHQYKCQCTPDGAIRLSENFHLLTMFELTSYINDALSIRNSYNCVIMTTMALECIQRIRKERRHPNDDESMEAVIPFILGKHTCAQLYVTRLVDERPTVQFVEKVVLGRVSDEDTKFTAKVAVLVANICRICNWYAGDFNYLGPVTPADLGKLPNAVPSTQQSENPTEPLEGKSDKKRKKPVQEAETRGIDPRAKETAASIIACRSKQVRQVTYPWPRVLHMNIDDDEDAMRLAEMKFYQQDSPFYFSGVLRSDDDDNEVPVFCKVWREGDARTNRVNIENEIKLHRLANEWHVPSTTVLENDIGLTAMDVRLDDSNVNSANAVAGGDTFHILVTTKHREDPVLSKDLMIFALALVRAVIKLHSIGILHCDIKPGNILWDASEKVVRLIDFGSAQMTASARSYPTTRGYVAPEVTNDGVVHSPRSEAYSVGKTLLAFILTAQQNDPVEQPCKMADALTALAQLLCHESVSHRMELPMAEMKLTQHLTE